MAPYNAAGGGPKQSVMDGVMTGDASYECTLKTALGVGRSHYGQSQNNGRTFFISARIFAPELESRFEE